MAQHGTTASTARADAAPAPVRPRNDVAQYDDLADEWWKPYGEFAMLHWIAAARAALLPPATRPGAVLVDLGCGAGCSPRTRRTSATGTSAWTWSRSRGGSPAEHGVRPVRGDVPRLPLADECADVVFAGEILEHVHDLAAVVAEACRVLRPGGTLVLDTIAHTWLGRLGHGDDRRADPGRSPRRASTTRRCSSTGTRLVARPRGTACR